MTPLHIEAIESAARLVAFGLTQGLKPAREPAYAQLIERYRTDAAMRQCTDTVARGLHLAVLGFTPQGIVLGADEDGPFVHRLSDYRRGGLSVEDRMCHGLVQLAIAAWCFPTAQDLAVSDDSAGMRFSTNKVVGYITSRCEELQRRSHHDPELGSPELREAWRAILQRPETRATPDGRRSANTLFGMVDYALDVLEKGGLVRRLSDDDGGTWQALAAYRIHVRELAAHDAFNLIQSACPGARDNASQE